MELLLTAKDIRKTYYRRAYFLQEKKAIRAVDGVSFEIRRGETLGLVGESGSGKSTLGRLILRLEKTDSGAIEYEGKDLVQLPEAEMRLLRKDMQIIFQDPFSSLNPRKTIEQILEEPLRLFGESGSKSKELLVETLSLVGLRENALMRYPHEFSGGQRQRIGIARAIILRPKLIVCDEPVSALDVSIQAQILNLLKDLQDQLGFTYLFISHDLRVIRHMCHRVMVMYQGKVVESDGCDKVFNAPENTYTKALLKAVPTMQVSR